MGRGVRKIRGWQIILGNTQIPLKKKALREGSRCEKKYPYCAQGFTIVVLTLKRRLSSGWSDSYKYT